MFKIVIKSLFKNKQILNVPNLVTTKFKSLKIKFSESNFVFFLSGFGGVGTQKSLCRPWIRVNPETAQSWRCCAGRDTERQGLDGWFLRFKKKKK